MEAEAIKKLFNPKTFPAFENSLEIGNSQRVLFDE